MGFTWGGFLLSALPFLFFEFWHDAGVGESVHPGVKLEHGLDHAAVEVFIAYFEADVLWVGFVLEELGEADVCACDGDVCFFLVFAALVYIADKGVLTDLESFVFRIQGQVKRSLKVFQIFFMQIWPTFKRLF